MATNAASDESMASRSHSAGKPIVSRPYRPPMLVKGPMLSAVTAFPAAVSGTVSSDFN
jgi:hypothetical protein